MIKIVANMGTENSTNAMTPETTVNIQSNNTSDNPSINAVPLLAIILAVVASCNSGRTYIL